MRTRTGSRISSPGVKTGRPTHGVGLSVTLVLLAVVAGSAAYGQLQDHPDDPPQATKPGSATDTEPVSIESRRSTTATHTVESRSVDLRVNKTVVLINVTVTDPLNRFVTGLEKEHFRLYEDKVEQDITQFSSEDAPISIGLVFDTSGSMGPKLQKSRQAAAEFFKTANPADEFFLVQFNDRPELSVP